MIRSRVYLTARTIYPTEQQSAQRSRQMPAAMIGALEASTLGMGRPPVVESPVEHRSTPVSPNTSSIWIAQTRSNTGTLLISASGEYLRFYCKSTRKDHIVRATTCTNVTDTFIAERIVRRLGLQLQRSATAEKSLVVDREIVLHTHRFIDVSSCEGFENTQHTYRFYVVNDCTFDILVGSSVSSGLIHRSAKDEESV